MCFYLYIIYTYIFILLSVYIYIYIYIYINQSSKSTDQISQISKQSVTEETKKCLMIALFA